MDRFGYAKTIDMATYERNKGTAISESKKIILCKNTDRLGIFTDAGNMYLVKVLDIPAGRVRERGKVMGTPVILGLAICLAFVCIELFMSQIIEFLQGSGVQ